MKQCLAIFGTDAFVVGDPVDVVSGANLDRQKDFELAGPIPLRWYRYYDSRRNWEPGPLGWSQTHAYDRRLVFDLDGIRHVGPVGKPIGFPILERNTQEASAGGLRLQRVNARTYMV